jgi:hypothetical protein
MATIHILAWGETERERERERERESIDVNRENPEISIFLVKNVKMKLIFCRICQFFMKLNKYLLFNSTFAYLV